MTIRKIRKADYTQHQPPNKLNFKPFGEASGEKPQKTEWVQTENIPIIRLLTEIRDELKKLNAK